MRARAEFRYADLVEAMSERQLVSILTPSYNQCQFIKDCVESVGAQTYANLEHIIFDGGSTDGTIEYLRNAESGRVAWTSESDEGQAHALQKAFDSSSGAIIGWLNSDDAYVTADVVGNVVAAFEANPDAGVVFGHAILVRANGDVMQLMRASDLLVRLSAYGSSLYQPTVFIRRQVIVDHGFVDRSFQVAMDYELWRRFKRNGVRFEPINEFVAIDRNQPLRKVLLANRQLREETLRVGPGRTLAETVAWRIAHAWLRILGASLVASLYQERLLPFLRLPRRPTMYLRQLSMPRRFW